MTTEQSKPQARQRSSIEDLKRQIAECLEKELGLLTEERNERARRLGLPHWPRGISA
jgi:hypothetical protein